MSQQLTRRQMLRTTGAAGFGIFVARRGAWSAEDSPNEKLNVAGIGVGGRGAADVNGAAGAGAHIVALCDVDQRRAGGTFARYPKAQRFADFRKMLEKIDKQIDAVVIGTPDHTHAPPGVMAMKMGKHCYCEKPLTHCVYESRVMTEVAAEKNLVTQLGTQIHAGENYRRVVELVRSGVIGPITEAHSWSGARYHGGDRPKDTPAVPAGLEWDLWLGPAPQRPYHPVYLPGKWRGWWDFATGGLGDFFCHYTDLPFWALDLKYPTTVQSVGSQPVHPEGCHHWMIVTYEFPARGELPPVKLTWYDGGKRPPLAEMGAPDWGSGVLFVGSKGMILSDYGRHVLLPADKFADFQRPEPTIPKSIGHHREWVEACKSGGPTTCNFAYSGPLTEAALLGAVSYRIGGKKLQWDAANLKAIDCPEAEPLVSRPYREGWVL